MSGLDAAMEANPHNAYALVDRLGGLAAVYAGTALSHDFLPRATNSISRLSTDGGPSR